METIEQLKQQLEKEKALRIAAETTLASLTLASNGNNQQPTNLNSETEQRWRALQQTAGDNIWEYDFLLNKISLTSGFKNLLGYTDAELPDTMEAWLNIIHPEDVLLVMPKANKSAEENKIHEREFRVRKKEGNFLWVMDRYMVTETSVAGHPIRLIGMSTIIDRIKVTEQNLKETSRRMMSLISNLQSGVLVEDENYNTLVANEIFCNMFRIPYGVVNDAGDKPFRWTAGISKHLFADPYEFEYRIKQLLLHKQTVLNDVLQTKDGTILSRDYIPVFLEGQFKGHLWRYTDITGARKIEQQLEAQRKFFEQLLNRIPADIAVYDSSKKYLYLNPMAMPDGVTREWMLGKTIDEAAKKTILTAKQATEQNKLFNTIFKTKELIEWIEKIQPLKGKSQYILRRMYPVLNDKNEIEIIIGYGTDITSRIEAEEAVRKSEEKYRSLIENMNLGMVEIDAEGIILDVNHSFCNMSGYEADELKGKSAAGLLTQGQSKTQFNEQFKSREKGISDAYNIAVKNKRGEMKWWHVSAAPLADNNEKVQGSISVQLDITQQKLLEQRLREAKQEAEQSALAKEAFLANISHEIRTPMNAIMGLGKLLNKTPLNDQQELYLNAIQTASENLLVIINDVLDFSKIEAGKISFEHIGFNLDEMARHALYVLRHKAEEKGIEMFYTSDAALPPVLLGDPYRINQVLLNMLSNALKFTEKGSVELRASMRSEKDGLNNICIQIIDTGIGMSPEFMSHLFEKFTQEDDSVTRKFGGTGLGMSISKQLVELMGGYLEVTSEKEKGTIISVFLPLPAGVEADIPQKEEVVIETNGLRQKRILLVEDNEMNRLVATTMLEQYGALITEAENGKAALEILDRQSFDAILMDVQMPMMDGLEATMRIREKLGNAIPIIALTANAMHGEQEKCFEAGMNDYIPKPFEEEQILQVIAKWLEQDITLVKRPNKHSKLPLYDLAKLRALSRGNEAFIERMLQLFVRDIPESVTKMEAAFHQGDLMTVKALAHRIKPSIQNMGISLLKDDLPEIELIAATGNHDNRLEPMIEKLRKVTTQVVAQVREVLNGKK